MSCPGFVEDGGGFYLTETLKNLARIHKLDPALPPAFHPRRSRQSGPARRLPRGPLIAAGGSGNFP
jgi:hypothetical protein